MRMHYACGILYCIRRYSFSIFLERGPHSLSNNKSSSSSRTRSIFVDIHTYGEMVLVLSTRHAHGPHSCMRVYMIYTSAIYLYIGEYVPSSLAESGNGERCVGGDCECHGNIISLRHSSATHPFQYNNVVSCDGDAAFFFQCIVCTTPHSHR